MNEWISVKDRLPEEYQFVIATNGKEVKEARFFHAGNRGGYVFNNITLPNVTHWMPLPQLPPTNKQP